MRLKEDAKTRRREILPYFSSLDQLAARNFLLTQLLGIQMERQRAPVAPNKLIDTWHGWFIRFFPFA